jgi:hypothetical protein
MGDTNWHSDLNMARPQRSSRSACFALACSLRFSRSAARLQRRLLTRHARVCAGAAGHERVRDGVAAAAGADARGRSARVCVGQPPRLRAAVLAGRGRHGGRAGLPGVPGGVVRPAAGAGRRHVARRLDAALRAAAAARRAAARRARRLLLRGRRQAAVQPVRDTRWLRAIRAQSARKRLASLRAHARASASATRRHARRHAARARAAWPTRRDTRASARVLTRARARRDDAHARHLRRAPHDEDAKGYADWLPAIAEGAPARHALLPLVHDGRD